MTETLKTHYPVGSYSPEQIGNVLAHARAKNLLYETVAGPIENFQLADDTRITVPEGMTAVVLVTRDPKVVGGFWNGFVFPS